MFLPLSDDNPHRAIIAPYVTWAIIALNVVVFLATAGLVPERLASANLLGLGLIPAVVTQNAVLSPELVIAPTWATWITYAFMHGGWLHLIGNMLFLWVFADNVEDAMGHVRFLIFYLLCAIAGALAHMMSDPASQAPLVGASGAVSGVLAAYLLLYPRARVFGLALNILPVTIPVWIAIGAFIAVQIFHVFAGSGGATAWWAHMGGLVAGAAMVPLFRSRGVPLMSDRRALPLTVPRIPRRRD